MNEYQDDSYKLAYARFQLAKTTGFCEECGWKDGDGVKTCFYSSVLGGVTHENSDAAAALLMTDSQRSLYQSYSGRMVYIDEKSERLKHEADARIYQRPAGYVDEQIAKPVTTLSGEEIPRYAALNPDYSIHEPLWIPTDDIPREYWPISFRAKGTTCEIMLAGKVSQYVTDFDAVAYRVSIYKPHVCGGHGIYLAPYHIGCTGCEEEVRLWEFGIDPDCG